MAIAALGGLLQWPTHIDWAASQPGYANGSTTMDADGEKIGVILRAPKAGTLDKVEFRNGPMTGVANGIRVSFQGCTNAAVACQPDETQDQFRVVTGLVADTWVVPGPMTSDGTDTGSKRTVAFGELFAIVIEFESFTASDIFRGSTQNTQNAHPGHEHANMPYTIAKLAGAWATVASLGNLVMALKYSDGSYVHVGADFVPWSALSAHTFNSGSTPDEIGIIWTPPVKCRAWGFHYRGDFDNAHDVVLYDTDGSTVLETVSLVSGDRGRSDGQGAQFPFSQQRTLTAGSAYRLVVKPGVSNAVLYYGDVNAAAIMDAAVAGQAMHQTHRTNAGAWTQTTTRRPFMGFVLDGFDDGAGGSASMLTHPGMVGGMRG